MPKVSVIMSVYNCEDSIKSSIESIKTQTFEDWECIICDDGSTDNTLSILNISTKDDKRFILIRNDENCGLGASLNRCISMAGGEYLARQDADDISLNTRFEEQLTFLEDNPDVTVVGTYSTLFDDKGLCWGLWKRPLKPVNKDWLKDSCVTHATVMMKKKDIIEVGCYNEKTLLRVEDQDLWIRLIKRGCKIMTLPKVLCSIHWDISDYSRRKIKYRWNEIKVKYKAFCLFDVPFFYGIYLLKPVITGLIPSKLMFQYHHLRFKKKIQNCMEFSE
jgi:glycosyltransferase EpsE